MKRTLLAISSITAMVLLTACPPPRPTPAPNATVSGYVTTEDGQPVEGILVFFTEWPYCVYFCTYPQTRSDANGFYALDVPDGTYFAECQWEQLEPKLACWANADGTPYIMNVPPAGQRIDFVVIPI